MYTSAPAGRETIDTWVAVNGCETTPVVFHDEWVEAPAEFGGGTVWSNVVGQMWADPTGNGNDVVLYTFSEGGHGWRYAPDGLASTNEFWEFLSARRSDYAGPVPEPATVLLLGSGIAGLLLIRRRRRRA